MKDRRWGALGSLVVVLLVLGVAGWLALRFRSADARSGHDAGAAGHPIIELDRLSARQERGRDGSWLSVFMRLRIDTDEGLPCFVFVVARDDHSSAKAWAIWPPQPPGASITASGHFHGATPTSGHAMTLSTNWQRITATLPDPAICVPFDRIVVYIVGEEGSVLLSRPLNVSAPSS